MTLNMNEPKVKKWLNSLTESGCTIHSITPLSIQTKQNGELLFAYLSADVTAPEGYKLLPIIFLRGDAVVIVPEIYNTDTGERKFLMVEQRRIASGEIHLEFPAGMLDRNVTNPIAVAAKELEEETGLKIEESALRILHNSPLFSSPGASDEKIWFFGTTINLSNNELLSLSGRITGSHEENEHIRTALIDRDEILRRHKSAQTLLALMLFEQANP